MQINRNIILYRDNYSLSREHVHALKIIFLILFWYK